MFPIDKYKFFYDNAETPKVVYAVSSFAGHSIRGIAKCDSRDTFSHEKGRELAAARCEVKVAKKRLTRALAKYNEALEQQKKTERYVEQMGAYLTDSRRELEAAEMATEALLEQL